jgi:hypothetical protein
VSQLDEVEYAHLADQVFEIEKLVKSGQAGPVNYLLNNFLHNAKSRMKEIRHEAIVEAETKKEEMLKELSRAAVLAEMEHNLNGAEKQQYAGFLKLDYFTKANFDELEGFYTNTWDRLSERGKTEMSTRVWEGVRRHEFEFEEMPEAMRKRETERTYLQLTDKAERSPRLPEFSAETKAAFLYEMEAGDKKTAEKILSRSATAEYPTDHRSEAAKNAASPEKRVEGKRADSQVTDKGSAIALPSLAELSSVIETSTVTPPPKQPNAKGSGKNV